MKPADLDRIRVLAADMQGQTSQQVLLSAIAPFAEVAVNIGTGSSGVTDSPAQFRDACLRAWLAWSITEPASLQMLSLDEPELAALLKAARVQESGAVAILADAQSKYERALELRIDGLRTKTQRLYRDIGLWVLGFAAGLLCMLNWVAL